MGAWMKQIVFSSKFVRRIKIIALRNGRWFRLHPSERAIINLIIKTINYVRNSVLINILIRIMDKISPKTAYIYKAYQIGLKMLEIRIRQAKQIGYNKIKELKDIKYIIYLGTWYLNTPIYYRPNIK